MLVPNTSAPLNPPMVPALSRALPRAQGLRRGRWSSSGLLGLLGLGALQRHAGAGRRREASRVGAEVQVT